MLMVTRARMFAICPLKKFYFILFLFYFLREIVPIFGSIPNVGGTAGVRRAGGGGGEGVWTDLFKLNTRGRFCVCVSLCCFCCYVCVFSLRRITEVGLFCCCCCCLPPSRFFFSRSTYIHRLQYNYTLPCWWSYKYGGFIIIYKTRRQQKIKEQNRHTTI